jgi:hypothetical protein
MSSYLNDSDSISSDTSNESDIDTPIIDSILDNNYKLFQKLLKEGHIKNETSDLGETPLQVAISNYKNDIKFITDLIEYGNNPEEGFLIATVNKECFKYFTDNFSDIYDYICPKTQQTLLISACKNGSLDIVSDVFQHTRNIINEDINNMNCFLATALNSNSNNIFEISGFLLNKLPDMINTFDGNKNNFLQILENNVCIKKNDKIKTIIIKYVIDKSIHLNHKNKQQKNILMIILENTMKKDWKNVYDYFLFFIKQGIDLNTVDDNNLTILNQCLELIDIQIDLTPKSHIKFLKEDFQHLRKIINLIIEYKILTDNEKALLKSFKQTVVNNNLI